MDQKTLTLEEVAELVGGELVGGQPDIPIHGVAALDEAGTGQLSFLANKRYLPRLPDTRATAVLVGADLDAEQLPDGLAAVVVTNPSLAFARMVAHFGPPPIAPYAGIHPDATVDPSAELGGGVSVGARAVIEAGARIGAGCVIAPLAYVGHGATLGAGCVIHPGVVLRERVELGERVTVHAGSVVGCDGYGYVFNEGRHQKIPQLGTVKIGDDVEIGANCTIDRARFDSTTIGRGTKIDNLVHIGHNVKIGEHCLLVAQVGVAGSASLGSYCILGGQAGVDGHVTLGDGARVAGKSGATRSLDAGETVAGLHALPYREFIRQEAALRKLPELLRQIKTLQQQVSSLIKPAGP